MVCSCHYRRGQGRDAGRAAHKSTRRGTSAGLRAIERKILQENGQLVAKPAPTQP